MDLNLSYPYPVLSPNNSDFKMGGFDYKCNYDAINGILNVNCSLTNETISKYIDEGKMAYALRIECASSKYRKTYMQKNPKFKVILDHHEINDNANLDAFVVVTKDIKNFNTDHLVSIYNGMNINYSPGDYIAINQATKLNVNFNNSSSKSFIKFIKSDSTDDIDVNPDEDGIDILLSPSNYNRYVQYRKDKVYGNFIFSSITVPALNMALYMALDEDSDIEYDNCEWLKAIIEQCEFTWDDLKADHNLVIKVISKVLRNPINAFFDELEYLDQDDEEF